MEEIFLSLSHLARGPSSWGMGWKKGGVFGGELAQTPHVCSRCLLGLQVWGPISSVFAPAPDPVLSSPVHTLQTPLLCRMSPFPGGAGGPPKGESGPCSSEGRLRKFRREVPDLGTAAGVLETPCVPPAWEQGAKWEVGPKVVR